MQNPNPDQAPSLALIEAFKDTRGRIASLRLDRSITDEEWATLVHIADLLGWVLRSLETRVAK